jgi:hypothetical protein
MPGIPLSDTLAQQAADAYRRLGTDGYQLIAGLTKSAFETRVSTAVARGLVTRSERRTVAPDTPMPPLAPLTPVQPPPAPEPQAQPATPEGVRSILMRGALTLDELAAKTHSTRGSVLDALDALRAAGTSLVDAGGRWTIPAAPAVRNQFGSSDLPIYMSRPDGTYLFGATGDNHLGSKYARLDVLDDLYDEFAAQGVDRVFNAGNWVDGEARFNVHDLAVHGMHAQLQHLADEYPRRPGITTYSVAGDDHEGWWAQREGVDIGRYAERVMRDSGREDWVDLGYMEAYVRLRHAQTGAECMLHLMHPGGGSAYAVSYTVQKIVEAYDGGDKPAVLLAGHYHKMSYNLIRNVHAIQTGTTQDQTPFMRKRKLAAHVGGVVVQLRQDPQTGAIKSCRTEFLNYFVRGHYNDRWSMSGEAQLADRPRV